MRGETVRVKTPAITYDEHNEEVKSFGEGVLVGNVLVAPGSTSNIADANSREHGTRAVYTLAFPKTFNQSLRGCHIVIRQNEYKVIGNPMPNQIQNCPTQWWYTCEVEDVDG